MAAAKQTQQRQIQSYVKHTNRPAWGVGVLVPDSGSALRTYLFADGVKRSFKPELCEQFIAEAEPPANEDQVRLSRGLASGGVATPKAINLELEAQIRSSPDDPAPYLVYADWLQTKQDPRGSLITVQHQLASLGDASSTSSKTSKKLRDAERALLETHGAYLLPESLHALLRRQSRSKDDEGSRSTRSDAQWKLGFLTHVRLARRPRQDGDIPQIIGDLLRHPSAHFLRSLTIGPLGDPDEYSYITTIAAIAKAKHPLLSEIFIGDFGSDTMELQFSRLGNVSSLLSSTPALSRLTLRAGSLRFDSAVKHPLLKELRVIVDQIASTNVQRMFNGILPELESFELSCPKIEIASSTLVRLLEKKGVPKLRRLALRKTIKTAAMLNVIAASPIIKQLEVLELDEGDLTDGDVARLLQLAPRLSHLKKLDLSGAPGLSANAGERLAALKIGGMGMAKTTPRAASRIPITEAEVTARSRDARSVSAARSIARPDEWLALGRDGDRLWGEYDGRDHYYVLARLDNRETSCSCASPKDPCKHALALLFMAAAQHDFATRPVPPELGRQTRERPRYYYDSFWE